MREKLEFLGLSEERICRCLKSTVSLQFELNYSIEENLQEEYRDILHDAISLEEFRDKLAVMDEKLETYFALRKMCR